MSQTAAQTPSLHHPPPPTCAGGCGKVDEEAQHQLAAHGLWAFPDGWHEPRLCPECREMMSALLSLFREHRDDLSDLLHRYRSARLREVKAT